MTKTQIFIRMRLSDISNLFGKLLIFLLYRHMNLNLVKKIQF